MKSLTDRVYREMNHKAYSLCVAASDTEPWRTIAAITFESLTEIKHHIEAPMASCIRREAGAITLQNVLQLDTERE